MFNEKKGISLKLEGSPHSINACEMEWVESLESLGVFLVSCEGVLNKPEACTTQTRHISGQLGIAGIIGIAGCCVWQNVKERFDGEVVAKIDDVIVNSNIKITL